MPTDPKSSTLVVGKQEGDPLLSYQNNETTAGSRGEEHHSRTSRRTIVGLTILAVSVACVVGFAAFSNASGPISTTADIALFGSPNDPEKFVPLAVTPETATLIAAGVSIASDWLKSIQLASHSIAAGVVNGTPILMRSITGIHTHHGQYQKAPTDMGPLPATEDEEKQFHDNIVFVQIDGAGAGAAEAIFGWEFDYKDKSLRLCLYAKHGHHVEAGAAIWEEGGDTDYDDKIQKSAESLIHTMQKHGDQTVYSKDGEFASMSKFGLLIRFSSGKTFTVTIEEVLDN
mmetsp:Transcript_8437/g.19146  ORF Transcript_8437/g.19146 Transcript_8437/m.19146 type:complete len:287 (+) Transcript_8437:142-1002(+)|eukprot:CAMPEP_0168783282 /NCGR_PEP_ID=MMETSP0725-20121227/9603_1 /TAXON_ID=265536 /ORGANISM="Amphiprora sp., Strain CCMP467" /LENGTH=286 /DNA_ID=CAMNT_0008833249 /DNA_START=127 /DNA_END=987 /DNA_ORIENTATION=-